jgi:hypothetical protein
MTNDIEVDDEWRAGFFVTDDNLVVEFGDPADPKNITLEFAHIGEKAVVEKVLEDRNFWVQIINALSAALKEKS